IQHDSTHPLALLEDFRGVLDALSPGHIRNVDEAIDAFFQSDKRPKVRQITDFALDFTPDRIALVHRSPRVRLDLLHPQGDALLIAINAQHHRLNTIADIDDLRRVTRAARPGHLRHVDQAFNTLFQFHKGPVVGNADDLARYP